MCILLLEVTGVAGTDGPVASLLAGVRAARGVGAPICVFFGVSKMDDDLTREEELDANKLRAAVEEAGTGGFRRPAVMKG